LPASGMFAPYGGGGLRDLLAHLVLPAVTLAAASVTIIARLTRSAMLELLSGAVLTETVFAWPGLGTLVVQGILARDVPLVQGAVLVIALTFVLVNLA